MRQWFLQLCSLLIFALSLSNGLAHEDTKITLKNGVLIELPEEIQSA